MTLLRSIDLETTGIPSADDPQAIVEVGWCDIDMRDGANPSIGDPMSVMCNPGRKITHEAMAVHHITDEMVEFCADSTSALSRPPGNPDYFVAHNADYERQFIKTGIPFICTYKVAVRLWPDAAHHNLQFLRYHLGLRVDNAMALPAHRAGPDAYVGAALMARILSDSSHPSIDDMVRWSNGPALLPRLPFGKHKGEKWENVPIDYLEWIVRSDLDRDMKANAKLHLSKRQAKP